MGSSESIFNPWKKSLELLQKSQRAVQRNNLDFALIYYEEFKPFYAQLSREQQGCLRSSLEDLQYCLAMLQLAHLRERLKHVR